MSNTIGDLNLRQAESSDIVKIIDIHKESFPEGIQTFIGSYYLEFLYKNLIDNSEIALVCEIDSNIVGFAISSNRKNKKKLMFQSLKGVLINFPQVLKVLLKRVLFLFQSGSEFISENCYNQKNIELGYIAVSENFRSGGIGNKLISEFEQIAINKVKVNSIITRTHNKQFTNYYLQKKQAHILKLKENNFGYSCILCWEIKS